jgi:glycosyltransferase involved in cell wall biosynthesis
MYWVIIPAYNEEESLPLLLKELFYLKNPPNKVIVVDNGSKDQTKYYAEKSGAIVLVEVIQGYGCACLKALDFIKNQNSKPDIVLFMDADLSDDPSQIQELVDPIKNGLVEFTLGNRMTPLADKDSLSAFQILGNKFACFLIRILFKNNFYDLGPFRAIRFTTLDSLQMKDSNYGWTVEMQVKAVLKKVPYLEIPVRYRKRKFGKSKISRNFVAGFRAGIKIIATIVLLKLFGNSD